MRRQCLAWGPVVVIFYLQIIPYGVYAGYMFLNHGYATPAIIMLIKIVFLLMAAESKENVRPIMKNTMSSFIVQINFL
jgi:hypothetical protein